VPSDHPDPATTTGSGKTGADSSRVGVADLKQRSIGTVGAGLGPSGLARLWGCRRGFSVCSLAFERGLGGGEVEADAGLGSVADADGSEFVGVLVDPGAVEVQVLGELGDRQHPGRLVRLPALSVLLLAVEQLRNAASDLLYGLWCEIDGDVARHRSQSSLS
jgi:hypothetical protein